MMIIIKIIIISSDGVRIRSRPKKEAKRKTAIRVGSV